MYSPSGPEERDITPATWRSHGCTSRGSQDSLEAALFMFFVFPGIGKLLLGGVTQIDGPGLGEVAPDGSGGKILRRLTFLQP